jgi:tetratricopeptide (TPR) repeat protein
VSRVSRAPERRAKKPLVPIERALAALSFDGLEMNFSCILRLASPPSDPYAKALARLEDEIASLPGTARPLALKGKMLSDLGRYDEARPALERAVALEPRSGQSRVWLGRLELLTGRFSRALQEQDRALKLGGDLSWARFYRAASLYALGRADEGSEELRLIGGGNVDARLAGLAFQALLQMQSERFDDALRALEPVLRARPSAAWVYALRARVHKGLGDKAACLRDFERALKLGPASWIHLERARVYEELGDILRSLDDVDAAMALDGPSAELFMRRAHLQVCRRHYHLAIPDYTEAIRLEPERHEAYLARATVHCIREDLDAAIADSAAAEKASGGNPSVALERLRMSIYAGMTADASKELESIAASVPELSLQARFLSGCLNLKTGAYPQAAAEFTRALSPDGGTGHDLKASFYRVVANGLVGPVVKKAATTDRARLLICGLGIKPPYTATFETLRAITSCDFIFNNLSEPEISGLLRLLSKECRPTMFDVRGADARWTRAIFKEVRPGRTVGFVTRGHPLVCGGLACSLMEESGRRGVDFAVYGAVSSMDTLAIETADGGAGLYWGHQVLDYSSVFAEEFTLDTRLPAVIYFNATALALTPLEHARFCKAMERLYSASHLCCFYGRSFHVKPDVMRLSELRGRHGKIDPSFTLLMPPKKRAGR